MAYLLSDQQWIRTAESEIKSDSSLDTKKTFFYLTLTLFLYTVMFLSLQILLLPFLMSTALLQRWKTLETSVIKIPFSSFDILLQSVF